MIDWGDTRGYEEWAGSYLAHNIGLLAFGKYQKRQKTLKEYVEFLDWMVQQGLMTETSLLKEIDRRNHELYGKRLCEN